MTYLLHFGEVSQYILCNSDKQQDAMESDKRISNQFQEKSTIPPVRQHIVQNN
jgi:hypothetical protein